MQERADELARRYDAVRNEIARVIVDTTKWSMVC